MLKERASSSENRIYKLTELCTSPKQIQNVHSYLSFNLFIYELNHPKYVELDQAWRAEEPNSVKSVCTDTNLGNVY